ncbi:MAG: hypothetical protein AAFY71_07840 [Bacteroidota bacterium]
MLETSKVGRYRQVFERLQRDYKGHVIAQSFLRQDQVLANNQSNYLFRFLAEQGIPSLPQQYLSRTDKFVVVCAGLYIFADDDAKPGTAVLQTFPNGTVFAGGTVKDLEVIYQGLLKYQTDNVVMMDSLATQKFRHVPETQQSGTIPNSSYGLDYGLVELPNRLVIDGASKNEFNLEIPTFTGIDLDNGTEGVTNKVALFLDGFLVEGAAKGSYRR